MVIAPETDKAGALLMAERIRKAMENHQFPHKETQPDGKLTVSIGVASLPDDSCQVEELIKMADKALYMAKNSGRNRVVDARLVPGQ